MPHTDLIESICIVCLSNTYLLALRIFRKYSNGNTRAKVDDRSIRHDLCEIADFFRETLRALGIYLIRISCGVDLAVRSVIS